MSIPVSNEPSHQSHQGLKHVLAFQGKDSNDCCSPKNITSLQFKSAATTYEATGSASLGISDKKIQEYNKYAQQDAVPDIIY